MGTKHWRTDASTQFINPYNFVRLGNGVQRLGSAENSAEKVSGSLRCRLIAKTPIAMPDASVLDEDERNGSTHKGQTRPVPFMRAKCADGQIHPIIPGSEIRGVIRSAFETVDNGCLSINNSNTASARHPFPRNPGILSYDSTSNKWTLYRAKMRSKQHHSKVNPGDKVRTWKRGAHKDSTGQTIMHKLNEIVQASNLEQAIDDYFLALELYCEEHPEFKQYRNNLSRDGKELWSSVRRETGDWPVFYELVDSDIQDEQLVYLSPAQLSRSIFRNRVNDLLGGDSPTSYKRCSDVDFACEPCRLFGFIGENGAVASRLRFSDGVMVNVNPSQFEAVTLKELSSPKTSSVEFYTERPAQALTWTYDYKTTGFTSAKDNKGRTKTDPERVFLAGEDQVKIRGRKFYLHHHVDGKDATAIDEAILNGCRSNEKTIRNMTTEVALAGSEFSFDLYFNGISEEQLKKLIWTLCIGENNPDSMYMHKIGHGKPLGLGSAKIIVEKVSKRYFNGTYAIAEEESPSPAPTAALFGQNNMPVQDFLMISNYELTKGLHVAYPIADANPNAERPRKPNDTSSHQWFIANRSYGPESQNVLKQDIAYTLPTLPDSIQDRRLLLLPKFVRDSPNRKHLEIERPAKRMEFSAPVKKGKKEKGNLGGGKRGASNFAKLEEMRRRLSQDQ